MTEVQDTSARTRTHMSNLDVLHLTSLAELRDAASEWDDLWLRSEVTSPTARAAIIALWCETFRPEATFHALVVTRDNRWLAALPLVMVRIGRVFTAAVGPGAIDDRTWIPGGALLLDPSVEAEPVMDQLVAGLRRLPARRVWVIRFDHVAIEKPWWRFFREALARSGMAVAVAEDYRVGLLRVEDDWEAYFRSLSGRCRRNMRYYGRRLLQDGFRFRMDSRCSRDEAEVLARRMFDIEDRSWKGETGNSIHRRGEFPFFACQAEQLAGRGQLELAFIENDKWSIAAMYGFRAKGVYQILKIGYDARFGKYSPGQLLYFFVFERLFHDPECRTVDFLGPMTESVSHWHPETYAMGHLVIAPHRVFSKSALAAYEHALSRYWRAKTWMTRWWRSVGSSESLE